MRVLGVIPARGGSRAVPRKNLRLVGGRPLIAHTIQAARQSAALAQFVTTTDDQEIARVAAAAGSPVVERPAELAGDETPMVPVIQHALAAVEPAEGVFDAVVVLQPTAPLRVSADIDAAVRLLEQTGADSVLSVYAVEDCHPSRMYRLVQERLVPYATEPAARLRQDLEPVYHRNGAIYVCRRVLLAQGILIGQDCRAYVMPRERSINIDEEFDLMLADAALSRLAAR